MCQWNLAKQGLHAIHPRSAREMINLLKKRDKGNRTLGDIGFIRCFWCGDRPKRLRLTGFF